MRRLSLWLRRSDGRVDDPGFFVKDVKDLDDLYQQDRFSYLTFSEQDKFEEGMFFPDAELEALLKAAFEAGRAVDDESGDLEYPEYRDYVASKGGFTSESAK